MMYKAQIAIDTSVLVGLINPRDLWRQQAVALHDALLTADGKLLYFDCVVAEAISAAARRLHEKKLNFNDALIALSCREREIPAIASFDADFDQVTWLRRLFRPEDIRA